MKDIDELAAEPFGSDDERILQTLGDVICANDPVPAGLTERVKFALTVEALGAQVAELLEAAPVGVRASYEPITTVTFTGDALSVLLTLDSARRPRRRITGWLSTPGATVTVHGPDGRVEARLDEDGRFEVDFSRAGLVHLVIQQITEPRPRPLVTPPIQI